MKISASLPAADVEFLDSYASEHHRTRSGALAEAVALLRFRDLGDQYETAWNSADSDDWDVTTGDGLGGAE